jgi:hypothetical protein
MGADTFRRLTGASPAAPRRAGAPRLGGGDRARVLLDLDALVGLLADLPAELAPFLPEVLDVSPAGLAAIVGLLTAYAEALARQRAALEAQAPPRRVALRAHAVREADGAECPICLAPFRRDEDGVVRVKCGHLFHRKCLAPWFAGHDTCPLCRAELGEP